MPQFSPRRLRDVRRGAGLSREKVAVAAAVSVSQIIRYEQGVQRPGIDAAARMASALGVTVDDLLEVSQVAGAAA